MESLLAQTTDLDPETRKWATVALGTLVIVIISAVGFLLIRSATRSVRRNLLSDGPASRDKGADAWTEAGVRVRPEDGDPTGFDDEDDEDGEDEYDDREPV